MNKRSVAMAIVSMILLLLLVVKSLWFDPVGSLDGDREKFKYYALERAMYDNDSLLEKLNLLTYRVMFVIQEEEAGSNLIIYRDKKTGHWIEENIKGQYRAKIRVYLFYFLPIKDIQVRGGI